MAVLNPCCCKLLLGVTIIAVLNIIGASILSIWQIISILTVFGAVTFYDKSTIENDQVSDTASSSSTDGNHDQHTTAGIILLVHSIFVLITCLLHILTSLFLFIGARTRNFRKCRIWYLVTWILVCLYVIAKFVYIGNGIFGTENLSTYLIVAEVIALFFVMAIVGYQLWVVYAFMEQVKEEQKDEVDDGTVHYAPKPGAPYGQGGYSHYVPRNVSPINASSRPVTPLQNGA